MHFESNQAFWVGNIVVLQNVWLEVLTIKPSKLFLDEPNGARIPKTWQWGNSRLVDF